MTRARQLSILDYEDNQNCSNATEVRRRLQYSLYGDFTSKAQLAPGPVHWKINRYLHEAGVEWNGWCQSESGGGNGEGMGREWGWGVEGGYTVYLKNNNNQEIATNPEMKKLKENRN